MSITQADTPCWHLVYLDGPTKGEPGEAHYATNAEAEDAADIEDAALEPSPLSSPCFTATCDGCGYVLDEDGVTVEHHPTREDAVKAAAGGEWAERDDDLICPTCNGA